MSGTEVFKVPEIEDGIVEAEIVKWNVKAGDTVKKDDYLIEFIVDLYSCTETGMSLGKTTFSVNSTFNGRIIATNGKPGDKIQVGTELLTYYSRSKREDEAKEKEKFLDYEKAIKIYEEIEKPEEAARVRKLKAEQGAVKVSQNVVHGDQVTKTEIKDSVLNRSNVGGGSSKMQELKDLTEMKKEGLIDNDEFKQMKKEILGK